MKKIDYKKIEINKYKLLIDESIDVEKISESKGILLKKIFIIIISITLSMLFCTGAGIGVALSPSINWISYLLFTIMTIVGISGIIIFPITYWLLVIKKMPAIEDLKKKFELTNIYNEIQKDINPNWIIKEFKNNIDLDNFKKSDPSIIRSGLYKEINIERTKSNLIIFKNKDNLEFAFTFTEPYRIRTVKDKENNEHNEYDYVGKIALLNNSEKINGSILIERNGVFKKTQIKSESIEFNNMFDVSFEGISENEAYKYLSPVKMVNLIDLKEEFKHVNGNTQIIGNQIQFNSFQTSLSEINYQVGLFSISYKKEKTYKNIIHKSYSDLWFFNEHIKFIEALIK